MRRDEGRIAERCPACGGPVECGMTNGDEACWCLALPPALPMPPEGSESRCYCPKCLQRLIDERMAAGGRPCEST
jgi:Cysteine-rich CWC